MKHELPKLDYGHDALEPYIDAKTMEIHHTKHHQAYIDKLNAALEKHPELQGKKAEELLSDLNKIPEDIRIAVKNHGGGHFNHSMFWKLLRKDVKMSEKVNVAIDENFGSFEEFKKKFIETSMTVFGSGWGWLVVNKDKLEIVKTPNQDSPLNEGKIPILGVDMWEHAMYLHYQQRKNEYLEAFFHVINWEFVEELYALALKNESFSVKPV